MLLAALAGLALDAATGLGHLAEPVVLPALMVLLAGVFLQITPRGARDAVRRVRVVAASLVINFGLAPVLAWLIGAALLGDHPELRLGLLMLLVTPCTDWYLVFTGLARGNTALATALLPLNLALQLVLLPVFVLVLGGTLVPIDPGVVLRAVGLVVLVPAALAVGVRLTAARLRDPGWVERAVTPRLGPATVALLCVAVAAMFAAHGGVLLARPGPVALLLPALAAFFALAYLVAQLAARPLRLAHPERATLTMTTMARNSPLVLAVAVAAFGEQPLIALALVVAPLIELPVLALAAQRLRRQPGTSDERAHPRHAPE